MLPALLACVATEAPPTAAEPRRWPVVEAEPLPLPAALAELDWLGETSPWRWTGTPDQGRADRGSWGLGNGRVFTLVGLDSPVNTFTNTVGPGYQRDDGFFGDGGLTLTRDGAALPVDAERIERVDGTAVVRTGVRSGDLWLTTVDVADGDTLLRHVTVFNHGTEAADGLALQPTLAGGAYLAQTRNGHTLTVTCDALAPGTLPAGGEWSTTCAWRFDDAVPRAVVDALVDHRAEAEAFLGRAAVLTSPDAKVDDLLESLLVTLWTQTDAHGVVSPMSRYTSAWLRDTEGPVRLYVATGLFEEAADALEGVYDLAVGAGAIQNSFPLDGRRTGSPPDWATVSFMPGREPAEAPSYPVLLDALVRRAWGRPALDDEAFLRACVERQALTDGLLPFSGDETFRYPMAAVVGDLPEALGWSANSGFLWIAAAEALGMETDDVRAATEAAYWTGEAWSPLAAYDTLEPFPAPYEEVSPQAARLGLSHAGLDALVATLLQPDGTLRSEDAVAYTGMVPGYALDALRDRPEAEAVFNGIDVVATPSGHFEELHGVDHRPLDVSHLADGTGADVTARYRPWEGGVVGAAVLGYLVGAEPDAGARTLALRPHLPNGWGSFTVDRLRLGDDRYAVTVTEAEVRLTRDGGADPWTVSVDGEAREVEPDATVTWSRGPG